MSGRNLDFQSSCCSAIIIRHLQGPLVSRCPQPRICSEGKQRQNTWPYQGQIRETKRHPTESTRQIPSGCARAPATEQVRHRQGGEGTRSWGKANPRERQGSRMRKRRLLEISYGSSRKAFIYFWCCFGGRNENGDRTMKIWGVLTSSSLCLLYQHTLVLSSTSLM